MRMQKRTTLVAATAALAAVAATGCGSDSDSGDKEEKAKIGLSISTLNNPFFVEMKKGAEAEAKAHGVDLTVTDAQDDASTQADQLQNFTSQSMDVIVINPVDSKAAGPSVKAAVNAKIPVIAADREVEGAEPTTTVASNNVQGGEMAAKALAEKIGKKGEVVILRGISGTSASNERYEGFTKGIKKYPDVKVVAKQPAEFDRAKGLDVMTNLIQSNPGVDGVFAENDEMALGAVKALGSKAGDTVQVVGFDGTPDGLKAIKGGTMVASVAQQPDELGKMSVRNAVRAFSEEDVDKEIKVPVKLVNKENAADFS